jgi:hypothetical protein
MNIDMFLLHQWAILRRLCIGQSMNFFIQEQIIVRSE